MIVKENKSEKTKANVSANFIRQKAYIIKLNQCLVLQVGPI